MASSFHDYLRDELARRFRERLAEEPWVCILCGDAGNGAETWTRWEPGTFWFPPEDHVCRPTSGEPRGISA